MKLSIITINLNNRDGLKRTIDSVVAQTFTDYEWIVVDGGSDDGSKELLEQYKDRFAWWCSEPDGGIYYAMNKGIPHATGEYINFMNSGDVFASNTILSEVFSKPHDADVLFGLMARGTIDGAIVWPKMMKKQLHWCDFFTSTINHQSAFIKREVFLKYGLYDESYMLYADWKHFAQIIAIEKVSHEFIPEIISVYEGGGKSETNPAQCRLELARLRKDIYPGLDEETYRQLYRQDVIYKYKWSTFLCKALYRVCSRIQRWSSPYYN